MINVKIPSTNLDEMLIANDKILMVQHLASLNIEQAKFAIPKCIDSFIDAAFTLGYPHDHVVAKPNKLSGNRGFKILCNTIEQNFSDLLKKPDIDPYIALSNYVTLLEKEKKFPDILMMEYLPGQDYSVYAYAENGSTECVIPMKRLKPKPGLSLVSQVDLNEVIIEKTKKVVKHFNLNDNINIQMRLCKNGVPMVYEINPRIAGSIILTHGAGVNFIKHSIYKALDINTTLNEPIDSVKMIRYYTEAFI